MKTEEYCGKESYFAENNTKFFPAKSNLALSSGAGGTFLFWEKKIIYMQSNTCTFFVHASDEGQGGGQQYEDT